jgi:hypothetical protein
MNNETDEKERATTQRIEWLEFKDLRDFENEGTAACGEC